MKKFGLLVLMGLTMVFFASKAFAIPWLLTFSNESVSFDIVVESIPWFPEDYHYDILSYYGPYGGFSEQDILNGKADDTIGKAVTYFTSPPSSGNNNVFIAMQISKFSDSTHNYCELYYSIGAGENSVRPYEVPITITEFWQQTLNIDGVYRYTIEVDNGEYRENGPINLTSYSLLIDSDDDDIPDEDDNCPDTPNYGQEDVDGDQIGDACDSDDDNDGVEDTFDPNPLNPDICGDSDGDTCDDCVIGTDDFGPLSDNNPSNDGTDTDGDGICNAGDVCPSDALNDIDSDGVCGDVDNCPESNLEQFIIIDSCDSGVENYPFDTGCTMSDLISRCR